LIMIAELRDAQPAAIVIVEPCIFSSK
jgi:hypothetical protein